MRPARWLIVLLAMGALLVLAPQALAAQAAWQLSDTTMPTNFAPGDEANSFGPSYLLVATNIGDGATSGAIAFSDALPEGIEPTFANAESSNFGKNGTSCEISGQSVSCVYSKSIPAGHHLEILIGVKVDPLASGVKMDNAVVSGGGAPNSASAAAPTTIGPTLPGFDFLSGFTAAMTDASAQVVSLAGSHPAQFTVQAGFPTEKTTKNSLGGAGHLRDAFVDLPRGEIANPAATPVLCTEVQLISEEFEDPCPLASQVGTATITTVATKPEVATLPLYNMVPPPGVAASFGFDALGVGVFPHLIGSVRSDGDFGVSGGSIDIDALGFNPIFGVQIELWSDPTSSVHDAVRGECASAKAVTCPTGDTSHVALLTTPQQCTEEPILTKARADSWENPGVFREATYEATPLQDCQSLKFTPTISAKPTTTLADSPSGLNFNLHQPQEMHLKDEEGNPARSTAPLKDLTLTLPEGLVVNPSQADGLAACSTTQVGLTTSVGESPVHFNKEPNSCPNAAKVGTVKVSSPLLAETEEKGTKFRLDTEGDAIPRPLEGSVYVAQPYQNPFGSLLAIYLVVEDPQSGIVAKLASEVQADSTTGRLTTTLEESPELPIEDASVHLFNGNRAPLRTPPACATYTTKAEMSSWSAPDETTQATDSFGVSASPATPNCPATPQGAPNAASFEAGTLTPKAGAFSPLALKLSRTDGTQPPKGFESILPRGLIAKLAGVPYCPEAGIAKARSREQPNQGALELTDPSCPAASQVGTVDVGAGAGPTPFHTTGKVYLAPPYKGAPLSVLVITPAIAGPFDLGDVAVRAAVYLEAESAQARAVSDPLPTILEGIPLDVRSIALSLNRPSFTLNPTSCDPSSVNASLSSVFGQVIPLSSRFQVGGCSSLPFKPKLSIRLNGKTNRGAHPSLRAVLTAKPGEAGIAATSVALPRSEFIDQAHFRTICTRVQFAANQCPAGSVYGHVKAISPLVDYPLEGPVYLRSSSHKLPDVVAALRGPASQPIEIDIDGRVDSVNGGIRNSFEALPDAPVSKVIFNLQGGKKGLFQNSTNICSATFRAAVKMTGQNGKRNDFNPVVRASGCGKSSKPKKKGPAKKNR